MDKRLRSAGVVMLGLLGIAESAESRTLRVPDEYPVIQAALDAAIAGDSVLVGPGVYSGDGNRDLSYGGKALTVLGSGPGCVLDVEGSAVDPHRAVTFRSEPEEALFAGFHVMNGYERPGAGIACLGTSRLTIREVTFWECISPTELAGPGGTIGCEDDAAPVIESCRMSYCYGAGIAADDRSRPLVESCIMSGSDCGVAISGTADVTLNFCRIEGSGGYGGIFSFASGARLRMVGCVVTANYGGLSGAGVDARRTDVTIQNSTIAGNRLLDGDAGSGVAVAYGSLEMDQSIVSGNCSDYDEYDYEIVLADAHALIKCSAVDSLLVRLLGGATVEYENGLVQTDPMFSCAVLQQDECGEVQGVYKGDGTDCGPNPCDPTAVAPSTWGRVRASFR